MTAVKDMPEIPLLYGSPLDHSITSPKKWIDGLRKTGKLEVSSLPKLCILTFPYMKAERLLSSLSYRMEKINLTSGKTYTFKYKGKPTCLSQVGIGSPMAGAELEILLTLGVEYTILIGGVGVLDCNIPRWTIIVPDKAVRDEGTSYHYEKPSTYTFPSLKLSQTIKEVLRERELRFVEGAVWTTDAPFRETAKKRRTFMNSGAICVDMEASALFSIARFHSKELAAVFYAGDCVGEEDWNLRIEKNHEEKRRRITLKLLEVSLEALHRVSSEK